MKLALYYPWIYLAGGIERTISQVVHRSRHEWTVYTHHLSLGTTFPDLADANIVALEPAISVRRSAGPLAAAAATIASTRLPARGHRAMLVASEGFGDLILVRNHRLPAVCFCFTPLKILHDPTARDRLVGGSLLRAAGLAAVGLPFAAIDRRLWRRYRYVLTSGSETRDRVIRARLRPPGQVEVLHPGVDLAAFKPGPAQRDPTFLVAGRIMWQKNIELAIDAIAELVRRNIPASLVVAGAVDTKSRGYLADLQRRAEGLPVSFEANPVDTRLADLYATSTAVLFTPPNEDWGLVPLEAMACGTPVIAVGTGGPTETVVSGKTGWLIPAEPVAFADRMAEFVGGARWLGEMRHAAQGQAQQFGWDAFVARVDEVMEEVVVAGSAA